MEAPPLRPMLHLLVQGVRGPNAPGDVLDGTPADGTEGAPPMMGTFPAEPPGISKPIHNMLKHNLPTEQRSVVLLSAPIALEVAGARLATTTRRSVMDNGEGMQLIAQVSIDGPGPFSIRVPDKKPSNLAGRR